MMIAPKGKHEIDEDSRSNSSSDQDDAINADDAHAQGIDPIDMTWNSKTDIHDLKKNLVHEEEFTTINHTEPIHVFLKLKPLSTQEMLKQCDQVS